MKRTVTAIYSTLKYVALISGILFISCTVKPTDTIIITRAATLQNENLPGNERPEQIAAVYHGKSGDPKILTAGFFSAKSPDISYDGLHLLFSAKKTKEDPWQIWEMNVDGSDIRQILSSPDNCTRPSYLPGNRLIFSKSPLKLTPKTGEPIFTCNLDGSDVKQITFNPYSNKVSSVLMDGRVLLISKHLSPYESRPVLMVLRPDGTKSELFYQGTKGSIINEYTHETSDGKIVFIEADSANNKGNIVSINYNRPLHSHVVITSGLKEDFRFVLPWHNGKMLVSCRQSETGNYDLYEFDPGQKSLGGVVFKSEGFDITEALVAEKHQRPKKLPSEVDKGVKTGLILCQNINFGNNKVSGQGSLSTNTRKIEIIGADSTLGVVDVADDGSFYLKVIADTPFRIRSIDDKGALSEATCDWIWLRPNERRGCVGCHENPELVPENRVPLSVKMAPVIVPVHVSKVAEKKISLE